jgi:hypothetical protein
MCMLIKDLVVRHPSTVWDDLGLFRPHDGRVLVVRPRASRLWRRLVAGRSEQCRDHTAKCGQLNDHGGGASMP